MGQVIRAVPWLALALAAPLAAQQAATQRPDTIAFAGAAGIYVWTGGSVVSRAHPVGGVVAHRLERRRPEAQDWERVADVAAVTRPADLLNGLDSTTRAAVRRALRQRDDAGVWSYIVRHPRADSLAFIIGNEQIRLALGVYGLDRNVRAGDRWQYRVSDVDAQGRVSTPRVSTVVAFPSDVGFAPVTPVAAQTTDRVVQLQWHIGRGHQAKALEIWRRRGTAGPFARIDSVTGLIRARDSLLGRYEDQAVDPAQIYQYYAVPRDAFMNRGPASDTTTVYTVALAIIPPPDSLRATSVDSVGLVLTWRVPVPTLARTIRVYRSTRQDGGWEAAAELPPTERRFVDARAVPMQLYYYRLTVTGLTGDESPPTAAVFGFFRSASPPAPPAGLTAAPVPRRRATRVAWAPGAEPDLRGYYVFRTDRAFDSLTADVPFEQVSPLLAPSDTTFVDSVSGFQAGREYAYVVQALNTSGLRSPYSNPAFVASPASDVVPPPTGLRGDAGPRRVTLFWDDITGGEFSVDGYLVRRREGRTGAYVPLTPAPLGRLQNRFDDTAVVAGRSYEYVVVAVDRGRSESAPSPPLRVLVPVTLHPAPPEVRVTAHPDGLVITWGEVEGGGAVRVYRYVRGGQPARLAEVPVAAGTYTDRAARAGVRSYYYLTLVLEGREGLRSAEVSAVR